MAAKTFRPVLIHVLPEQHAAVRELAARTGQPMTELWREALADLLAKKSGDITRAAVPVSPPAPAPVSPPKPDAPKASDITRKGKPGPATPKASDITVSAHPDQDDATPTPQSDWPALMAAITGPRRATLRHLMSNRNARPFLRWWSDQVKAGLARTPIVQSEAISAFTIVPGLNRTFAKYCVVAKDRRFSKLEADRLMAEFDDLCAFGNYGGSRLDYLFDRTRAAPWRDAKTAANAKKAAAARAPTGR